MNILVRRWLGGLIGWLASAVMYMRKGILLNVIVGIVGAVLGGWFLSPLVGYQPSIRATSAHLA